MQQSKTIRIIGGGLAGSEAAWQALNQGMNVVLHEMRPTVSTNAHKSGDLAELVCSNSLKSVDPNSASGCLKTEMQALDSLIVRAAYHARVPAGQALAVDRQVFSGYIASELQRFPNFCRVDGEVTDLAPLMADGESLIIATGPLTSKALTSELERLTGGEDRLFFYDAIAPTIAYDSVDMNHAFRGSRYDKEGDENSTGDYLNLPLNRDEYEAFIDALTSAEYMPLHEFEKTNYFEACLPIEVMVGRGRDTLRFGPMKPVGLTDPRTGRRPWANLQLRQENKEGTMYSMVGFQTKMKWPEQKRVFGLIPALKNAEFLRYGSIHRNTYLNSPKLLNADLSFKQHPRVFLAGQITGVEGYLESAAIGLVAARMAAAQKQGLKLNLPPKECVLGALCHYITEGSLLTYQPMNANLGLLPHLERTRGESKADKKARQCDIARQAFQQYLGVQ